MNTDPKKFIIGLENTLFFMLQHFRVWYYSDKNLTMCNFYKAHTHMCVNS